MICQHALNNSLIIKNFLSQEPNVWQGDTRQQLLIRLIITVQTAAMGILLVLKGVEVCRSLIAPKKRVWTAEQLQSKIYQIQNNGSGKHHKILQMMDLAYEILGDRHLPESDPDTTLLQGSFYCENPDISNIGQLIIKAFNSNPQLLRLPHYDPPEWRYHDLERTHSCPLLRISHGGGYRYIKDFLNGYTPGYAICDGGIYVAVHCPYKGCTPSDCCELIHPWDGMDKAWNYAKMKAAKHLDTPAILTALVPIHFLYEVPDAHKAGKPKYEAILSSKWPSSVSSKLRSWATIDRLDLLSMPFPEKGRYCPIPIHNSGPTLREGPTQSTKYIKRENAECVIA